jgi:hypothetical protein
MRAPTPPPYLHLRNTGQGVDGQEGDAALGRRCSRAVRCTHPPGIIPIILLDSYCCHIMALVVNVIQDLGCEVVHIPGSCTGLVQPLDVGYNKHSCSLGGVHDQRYA